LGHVLLAACAGSMIALWSLRRGLSARTPFRWTGVEWLAVAGGLLLGLQLLPLPQSMLSRLSPAVASFLPLWSQADKCALGGWPYLSLMPEETRLCLLLFLSYFIVFWVTAQRLETIFDVERIFRYLAWAVVIIAGLGILQQVAGNGKFFWFYQHPYSTTSDAVKGCFTNRNHFADFLAIGIGPLLWWALGGNSIFGRGFVQDHLPRRNRGAGFAEPRSRGWPTRSSSSGRNRGGLLSSQSSEGEWLRTILLGMVLFAGLLSLSRAGNALLLVALMVTAAALYRAGVLRLRAIWGLGLAAAVTAAALGIFGRDRVRERFDDLTALSWEAVDSQDSRTTVWRNTWRAARDFPLFGSGAGSFRFVQAMYEGPRSHAHYYSHAEQSYLQVLLETGVPGLALLLIGLALIFVRAGRAWRLAPDPYHRLAVFIAAVGIAAHALHGLVDFVFYVPGLSVVAVTLAACVWRLSDFASATQPAANPPAGQFSPGDPHPPDGRTSRRGNGGTRGGTQQVASGEVPLISRLPWLASAGCAAVLTAAVIADRLPAVFAQQLWERYLILSRAAESRFVEAWNRAEGEASPRELADAERGTMELLIQTTRAYPRWAEPHLRLAQAYLRRFHTLQLAADNAMPLSQIRDAAVQSQFPNAAALDAWLEAAVGEHRRLLYLARHEADQAVRLCPLLGEAYLTLGELGFLRGEGEADLAQWTAQALRVAPYNGNILFEAGLQAFLAGDKERWILYWRQAFQAGRRYQYRLIQQLAGRSPRELIPEETRFLLTVFEPDLDAIRFMYRYYRKSYPAESLAPLARAYLSALQSRIEKQQTSAPERSDLLVEAHFVLQEMGDAAGALAAARQAVAADPKNYSAHYHLSQRLEELGYWSEAEEHVRWCLLRRPGHRPLERRLAALHERQLSQGTTEAEAKAAKLAQEPSPLPR